MRSYLPHLNIVGGVGVWREGEIMRHCIENLVKHCDTVCIMQDNPDERTASIVEEYRQKHPDIIVTGFTNLPHLQDGQRAIARQKTYEGELIEEAFKLIKTQHEKRPIDLLYFIDSDEMFTDHLPVLAEKFWASNADTVFIRPIEVYDSFHIIVNKGLVSHAKIYKYRPDITAIPYGARNYYRPYSYNRNIIKEPWYFVHLARLTKENRELRVQARGNRETPPDMKLRRVSKPAYQLTKYEGEEVFYHKDFVRFREWDGNHESIPIVL